MPARQGRQSITLYGGRLVMDTKDLAQRYGLSEQAARKFIRQHLADLNSDGEHARRTKVGWTVDDVGLKRLDALRGYQEMAVEAVDTPNEMDELRAENQRLMKMLLASQAEVIRLQRALLDSKNEPPSLADWFKTKFLR